MKRLNEGNAQRSRIDAKCVDRGISRRELARRSGVPIRTVESWCCGHRKSPDVYQLWRVARVLQCRIEDLLDPERLETE